MSFCELEILVHAAQAWDIEQLPCLGCSRKWEGIGELCQRELKGTEWGDEDVCEVFGVLAADTGT